MVLDNFCNLEELTDISNLDPLQGYDEYGGMVEIQ